MITLIRHAESTFNAYGDLTRDCPITVKGMEFAKKISGKYDLVICSSLKRARQTLDASSLVYSNVFFSELCREVRDGVPINLYNGESTNNDNETEEQINIRIEKFKSFLHDTKKACPNIAVITHYRFIEQLTGKRLRNCEQVEYTL